jgi:hypothetical protein
MSRFNQGYRNLFCISDKEDVEEGEGEVTFSSKWGWIYYIDIISELTKNSWDKVFEMGIYEFFNLLAYRKDKQNEIEKAKNNNGKVTY